MGEPSYLGTFTPPPAATDAAAGGAASPEMWLAFLHINSRTTKIVPFLEPKAPIEAAMLSMTYSCYSLDRRTARDLLVAPPSATGDPWEKVQALVAEKKAQLEFVTSMRTTGSGQNVMTEETHQIRYMEEYTPPYLNSTSLSGQVTDNAGNISHVTMERPLPNTQRIAGFPSKIGSRPTGITMEFQTQVLTDWKTVTINEAIQHTDFRGMLKIPGAGAHYQPQPVFQVSKIFTGQAVTSGKPTLVSTLSAPGADGVNDAVDSGRTRLLFVQATITEP
jgi:hypothetical protein